MNFIRVRKFRLKSAILIPVAGLVLGASAFVSPVNLTEKYPELISQALPDTGKKDTLKLPYPFEDNLTDPISNKPVESPLYLKDPGNVKEKWYMTKTKISTTSTKGWGSCSTEIQPI